MYDNSCGSIVGIIILPGDSTDKSACQKLISCLKIKLIQSLISMEQLQLSQMESTIEVMVES